MLTSDIILKTNANENEMYAVIAQAFLLGWLTRGAVEDSGTAQGNRAVMAATEKHGPVSLARVLATGRDF